MAACTTSRTRAVPWTSTVHLLFGSPATCVRPVALRPRLATGLPLSIGRRRGSALTDGTKVRPPVVTAREAKRDRGGRYQGHSGDPDCRRRWPRDALLRPSANTAGPTSHRDET